MSHSLKPILICTLVLLFTGCSNVYYGAMEKVGVHKRDILVDRVQAARDSQEKTKEQFASALEHFSSVVNFQGGALEEKYFELKDELERIEKQAKEVRHRIEAVENVAEALFDEWEAELDQYSSASLRQASEQQLRQTRRQYAKLIRAMKKAEAKIEPVLQPLRDQVLFLKHNLNARAIASLQTELTRIETDVSRLILEMERAMEEADSFIKAMKSA
ncbi:DUF2959 domain-containing protein [Desulfolithobacter dissulfuricans]|uniref:DUF2959 domain-containing protein n=1 Tax=Desulfolithobacter dissulfuricans TaxID=2795293 RepID=A0A915XIT6_9BACT|nr:DUF2959 domain-containing protein [Desulfolithobacter dissulfuricans]BCO07947.1 DUF2959 domain-containing protein [Desulfolithobacter dissulfuricans]